MELEGTSLAISGISAASQISKQRRQWRDVAADIFSFPVMCMALLSAVILRYCIRGIAESDIWWHMRNAQDLLHSHAFPRVDTYSFGAAGSPWMNFEWLSEIPFFLAFKHAGLQGLLIVYFALLVIIFSGVYYQCCRAGTDCKDAAIATLGAICLAGVSMAPRTLLFGWLCMIALLLVLDRFHHTGKGLWVLPPLFALWINLHGSWLFGVIVLALTIGSGFLEGEWGVVVARKWSSSELRALLLTFAGCLLALFVNPFGYKLIIYPYTLLLRQQGVMEYIDEWQPVNFGTINGKLALLLIFCVIASALLSTRRWRLDEVLLTAFALWAALSHVRFLFFAGLVIVPILAPRLALFPPYERELDKPWLNAVIIAAVIAGVAITFPSSGQLQQRIDDEYPKAAMEYMRAHGVNGRLFNQYKWGGYIEWNYPEVKPFIDGRADIFIYNGVFRDFLRATALDDSFAILDQHKIDDVLLQPNEPLVYMLKRSPSWRVAYADNVAVLLERDHP